MLYGHFRPILEAVFRKSIIFWDRNENDETEPESELREHQNILSFPFPASCAALK